MEEIKDISVAKNKILAKELDNKPSGKLIYSKNNNFKKLLVLRSGFNSIYEGDVILVSNSQSLKEVIVNEKNLIVVDSIDDLIIKLGFKSESGEIINYVNIY